MLVEFLAVGGVICAMLALFGIQQYLERSRQALEPSEICPLELSDLNARILAKHNQIRELTSALKNKDHITVSDLMTEKITVVDQHAPLTKVRELMTVHRTRHLLVQDANSLLVGIISDRDLARNRGRKAQDVMTHHPTSVAPDRPISDAVGLALSKRISCLPVVDGVELKGVITSTDLLVILECLLEVYESTVHEADRTGAALPDLPLNADPAAAATSC